MPNIFFANIILLIIIYLINAQDNNKTQINNNSKVLDITKPINKNINNNEINLENKSINISNIPPNILEINKDNIKPQNQSKNINITIYDNNKILKIMTNSSLSNNSSINEFFYEDDNITRVEQIEHIVIENTHEDQLAESIFYFLSFILVIFIILFLYKFYQCYCQNAFKDFGDDSTIKNLNNDPELQRISTHDDENILEDADG